VVACSQSEAQTHIPARASERRPITRLLAVGGGVETKHEELKETRQSQINRITPLRSVALFYSFPFHLNGAPSTFLRRSFPMPPATERAWEVGSVGYLAASSSYLSDDATLHRLPQKWNEKGCLFQEDDETR
jgi:hypothetical protein